MSSSELVRLSAKWWNFTMLWIFIVLPANLTNAETKNVPHTPTTKRNFCRMSSEKIITHRRRGRKRIMCENDLLSTAAVWCAVLWNRLKSKVSLVKACIAVYQNPAFVFVHTFFLVLFHFLMNWNFRFQKPLFCFLRRLFSIHDVMTNAWCWLLLSSHFWCQWASIRDGVSFQRSQFFAHKKLNNRFFFVSTWTIYRSESAKKKLIGSQQWWPTTCTKHTTVISVFVRCFRFQFVGNWKLDVCASASSHQTHFSGIQTLEGCSQSTAKSRDHTWNQNPYGQKMITKMCYLNRGNVLVICKRVYTKL